MVTKAISATMSRELLEKGFWFDKRISYEIVSGIQRQLIRWTGEVIRRYKVVPFDYNREEAMVSHLATAADRAKFFVIQEYPITVSSSDERRADLLIKYGVEQREACVFEVKKRDIRPDPWFFRTDIDNALNTFESEWNRVVEYASQVAKYQCALVGMKVLASANGYNHSRSLEDPEAQIRAEYYERFNLRYSYLESTVKRARSNRVDKSVAPPNFYWGYILRHKLAQKELERAFERRDSEFAIGMLWLGRASQSR